MKTLSCAARVLRPYLIAAIFLAVLSTIHTFLCPGKLKGESYGPQRLHLQPPFRYAIIYNDPGTDGSSRTLIILMEPSEFSEANLRALFGLLSQRYKSLPKYNAYIETSLQDVQTPEEHAGPGYSEQMGNPNAGKTAAATIRHSSQADILYIYLPSRATEHPTKIDLRVGGADANH
jgi:hypothetical protein